MLPVVLFIAFWVVLALIVFFVAGSGGPGHSRPETGGASRRRNPLLGPGIAFMLVAFGVAVPILVLHGNDAHASKQVGGQALNASEKRGRYVFAFRCGFCHTLAGANAYGKVGPNLDSLKPPKGLVVHTVTYGCLQTPPTPNAPTACLGQGVMPAGIVSGQDENDVANFVAKVAGHE